MILLQRQLGILFLLVVCSTGFIPNYRWLAASLAWKSLNHKIITRSGLWLNVIEFLKDNPRYVNKENELTKINTTELVEGRVPDGLYKLVKSSKVKDAINEIKNTNARVDSKESAKAEAHFDGEQFTKSSRRLVTLKKQVIALIKSAVDNNVNYRKARKVAGRYLHTLQDFYSHSNWVENGNRNPLEILGDKILGSNDVAAPDEKTCTDCTPEDDCQNNLVQTGKLTSGYYSGQDVTKPVGVGKCSHGGPLDGTRKVWATGGINKDTTARSLSPHHRLHKDAAKVAITATKLFFDSIRKDVGDTSYAKFLNMVAARTLTFAIDTTGSMRDEIAGVKKETIRFIEGAEADSRYDFYYVLVPFNDPDVGPVLSTSDAQIAKDKVDTLQAAGGDDCPEMGMSGLYLALLHSLPKSKVYYFSDASAKDAQKWESVISVATEKEYPIYIFSSGKCNTRKRRSLTEDKLYKKIASLTGGQYFEISKSNIDGAMNLIHPGNISYANSTFILEEISLLSVQGADAVKSYIVQIDSTIASIKAVLSAAANAKIMVNQPAGNNGTVTVIVKTTTLCAVRIIMPMAGAWTFKITAYGAYTLQVTAQSSLAFSTSVEKEEYSDIFETILVPITGNPIKGEILYVTVEPTEMETLHPNKNITGYLIDTEGNNLESFELEQGQDFYDSSYYGSVKINHDAFKIMFVGHSRNGEIVQRLLPRVIRPQQFELKLSTKNNSLTLTPNENASINVILKNAGKNQTFSIVVTDDQKFVTSFSPISAAIDANETLNIQIIFFAPVDTKDATTTSVSVSASINSASTTDLVNFLSFELSVFSKTFQQINETEAISKLNITKYLVGPKDNNTEEKDNQDDGDDYDDGLPTYAVILISVAAVVIVVSLIVAVILKSAHKNCIINSHVNP